MTLKRKLWQLAARYVAFPLMRGYASKYGSLTKFYNNEARLAGKSVKGDTYESHISSLLSVYELEDELYGFSPCLEGLNYAIRFGLLTPLTFTQSEFNDIAPGIKQNKRKPSVFIESDGTIRDIDGFYLVEQFALNLPNGSRLIPLDDTRLHGCVFFFDDTEGHKHWWVASSSAVFNNTHKYKGESYEIPVIRVNNKTTGDFYHIALESKVPEDFYKRFRFMNALKDELLTESEKTMLAEDLAFVSNNHLEEQLGYAYICGREEPDEIEDYGYFKNEEKFIMDDMVDDVKALKLVNRLLDDDYSEELIHVTLDKSNKCRKLVIDCSEGTQYDIVRDAIEELDIKDYR